MTFPASQQLPQLGPQTMSWPDWCGADAEARTVDTAQASPQVSRGNGQGKRTAMDGEFESTNEWMIIMALTHGWC